MASILITGGAGFIGSHIARALLDQGHDLVLVDNLDAYYPPAIKRRNLDLLRAAGDFTFAEGDAGDYRDLYELIRRHRVEVIFHQSARPGIRQSLADPQTTHRQNVVTTLHLLQAAIDQDVELFVNASSSSVYGEAASLPLEETQPPRPVSPYGVSKMAAEAYTRCYHALYGLPTVSLRYFTVYGPRMRPDLAIFIFTRALLEGRRPVVFGDGEQKRDFTYIDDVVAANLAVLGRPPAGEVINIGYGSHVSVNHLLAMLGDLTGVDVAPLYRERVRGDVSDTWACVDKARRLLGWEPTTDLATGLRRFVDWYRGAQDFYAPLLAGY
ncbi:MAG: NAD-dependent epimerase/dehydratase family protein [Candidatus Thermoplasmatota archaeon]|nr:NAD-dependent epimerase/dehydratase family protein [Candidatus Thermoplasmatota archaeon]